MQRRRLLSCLSLLMVPLLLRGQAVNRTPLPGSSGYPRVVQLGPATTGDAPVLLASTGALLFRSMDAGLSFISFGEVAAKKGSKFVCCETLFPLPSPVGSLARGTLLFSGTFEEDGQPAVEIYASSDDGAHWRYLSTPVKRSLETTHGGFWEPHFSIAKSGALVIFWSDETRTCCSQTIMQSRSVDGIAWEDLNGTVVSTVRSDRPGMPFVSKLPTGGYFMTYEVCGDPTPQPLIVHTPVQESLTGPKCDVYFRTSKDGWDYGPPSDMGTLVTDAAGQHFRHAPTNAWMPDGANANGALFVVGQVLVSKDGSTSSQNGRVLFTNSRLDGSGAWTAVPAPVEVRDAFNNPCPNYSSVLLAVAQNTQMLELAGDFKELGKCGMFAGRIAWKDLQANAFGHAPSRGADASTR